MSKVKGKAKAPAQAPAQAPMNYSDLIQQDPAFMALKQQISAQQIADAAARQQATDQALIQYGYVPDFAHMQNLGLSPQQLQMLQQDISPQVAALANQNTASGLSEMAQMQHDEDQAIHALRNNLAARGALSSGDDAYRTNEQQRAYALAQNNALQKLLASLNGYQQNYLTNQQNEQQQLLSGLQTAEQNQFSLYPYMTQTAQTAYNGGGGMQPAPHHVAPKPMMPNISAQHGL